MSLREKLPQYLVTVSDYNWSTMPLGGYPSLGIPAFNPGYTRPPFRIELNIPGTPRLIHRRKDSMFPFNHAIDHYGVVFATGQDGWALPDDWVFEIRAGSNHEHTPFRYREFDKGDGPVYFHKIKADSKANVIRRLEEFFNKPKKYRAIQYNCEAFAREVMTGVAECTQITNAVEVTQMVFQAWGEAVVKTAEQEKKRRAEAEEAKRKQAAALLAPGQSPPPTPQVTAPAVEEPMTVPEAMMYLGKLMTPPPQPVVKAKKPAKRPRKKPQ